ncbi:MAG: HNH endonuclease [Bacteroidales bacterium]|nr:HNH endonuclease [Bacteroidales bacterium]
MANWTREQTIIALSVYCKIPFNQASNTNPEIVAAARLIGRSPAAIKMKVGNFGSFDPELRARGIVGLSNSSKLDEEIWNEYCNDWERLAYDSERIRARLANKTLEEISEVDITNIPAGRERETMVKQRINQSFFRTAVLTAYNNRCCITGLTNKELLEASHIVDWAKDIENRLNPSNGLCLNILFHRAYDENLIGITPDYEIVISDRLLDEDNEPSHIKSFFSHYNNTSIHLPDRFLPNRELLDIHYQRFVNQ